MINFSTLIKKLFGDEKTYALEHRCYNGVCFFAANGCFFAAIMNSIVGISIFPTIMTLGIGIVYGVLYFKARFSADYQGMLWLFILSGAALLALTWFLNGGINGPDLLVSMVALVAMTAVLKPDKRAWVAYVFIPLMSFLFVWEYFFPELLLGYQTRLERFLDLYLTFLIATVVIFKVLSMVMDAYNLERQRLAEANHALANKVEELNRVNATLEQAISEIKSLSGLLPICSWCKKVRDDKGYWNLIESYVQDHSEVDFSHSICPECAREHFPELDLNNTEKP